MPSTAPRVWQSADASQAESRIVARRGPVPNLDKWYREGQDVHLKTTLLIARVIQQSGIKMPKRDGVELFTRYRWDAPCVHPSHEGCAHFKKGDEEREQTKRIIHGGNYKLGLKRTALILGVDEKTADILLKIYFSLNPEIASKYHRGIEHEVKTTRMITTPEPVPFQAVIWDILNDETYRQCYARYPQSIVGGMTARNIRIVSNVFREDKDEQLKEQWCAWYGRENWDEWRRLRDSNLRSPRSIRWSGFDVRHNGHDAASWSIPNDPDLLGWAGLVYKQTAEVPIMITKEDPLVIPVDFKVGPNLGDMKDYKLPMAA